MAALIRAAQVLRFDSAAWERFARTTTLGSSAVIAMGAYAVVAWDRFGFQTLVAPRASVRILLIGFYGWFGLALLVRSVGRSMAGKNVDAVDVARLIGVAHLPVLIVAIAAQAFGVMLDVSGPARVVAGFAATIWMPGQLVGATRRVFGIDTRGAVAIVAGPYLAWIAIVGTQLTRQLGHLL